MGSDSSVKLTPMMQQYRQIKSELPKDALLLFRLGDFYEMFMDDACQGAQILNIALTKRAGMPMCGIPYHAAESYLSRLLKAGRKVAICDQMEEPRPGQLVKRQVTQILSPGTHFDERMLRAERNNFLTAISHYKDKYGVAFADLTTGDFFVTEVADIPTLQSELSRQRPAEIVYPSEEVDLLEALQPLYPHLVEYEDWVFAPETSFYTIKDHFRVASLDCFGITGKNAAIAAAGAVLHYLEQNLRRNTTQMTRLVYYQRTDYLLMDANTLRSLEILEPLNRETTVEHSLFGVLNKTSTPMGARLLRNWLSQPLTDIEQIRQRQKVVQTWFNRPSNLENFRKNLRSVRDLERTITRLNTMSGNARDLQNLRGSLEQLPLLQSSLEQLYGERNAAENEDVSTLLLGTIDEIESNSAYLEPLAQLIADTIVEEPPVATKDGGIIKTGADAQLDELRDVMSGGKDWIAKMQQEEIVKTGIPSLKVRFNSVFGYYIEVTKTHLDKVPSHYIRKQTIANGERFITQELKDWEGKILGAEERVKRIEYDIFSRVRATVLEQMPRILKVATALAQMDILGTFAMVASLNGYVCPEVGNEGILRIVEGRHPVLEQTLPANRFVANDTVLEPEKRQLAIITGPNMAGKSTYIRQTALLVLMAQTGSFIPAKQARVDVVDRIFTRIGASDDIARGQSTFMVEMSEAAAILNNATSNSLIILDEIGRGTSTFDGLSLAWSIAEHIHNRIGAKTLFATHYHELTELANRLERVHNLSISVRECNEQIVFIHKIVEGAADKSYGIHVARLAGVPESVLKRAKEVLKNLEESELAPLGDVTDVENETAEPTKRSPRRQKLRNLSDPNQLDLFTQLGI